MTDCNLISIVFNANIESERCEVQDIPSYGN